MNLILIGGGGHCKAVIDVIETIPDYKISGILDINFRNCTDVLGYPLLGTDERTSDFISQGFMFLVTVGQIKSADLRKRLFSDALGKGAKFLSIISKSAIVGKNAIVGKGSILMHHAIINSDTNIGQNCIINTNSLIEHESIIGNHTHISTGSIINANCIIGDCCFVGSNSVVSNNISICDNVVIGAGSVVVSDILSPGTYFGNPARKYHA